MSGYALEARGLKKRFGALVVTDDVSLRLKKGARHALIGPNGAGKTTLVAQLSGVLQPDDGQVLLNGEDITRLAPARRTRRGLVRTFQITNLFTDMTVTENLFLAVSQHRGNGLSLFRPAGRQRAVLEQVEALIERVRLSDQAGARVSSLAYGQQRLIEIALALALEPKVLMLDEPAAGIPTSELDLLLRVIEELDPEMAILIIEHDMDLVRRFATEATVLVRGKVLVEGPLRQVMDSEEVHRVYLGSAAAPKRKQNEAARA
jgi:ABC-type branched-chain amino acid transport systems, ATPase component